MRCTSLSTRTSGPTPRLRSYRAARACQSIIRIGLLKFLGTDGERMDIHSFSRSGSLAQDERIRSFDPRSVPTTYIHGHMLADSAGVQRSNRSTRGRVESSPFNFVTYAPVRLIVSAVEGCLDVRILDASLSARGRGNVSGERFLRLP